MFGEKTRRSIQLGLQGFGDSFAGRGPDINALIPSLAPLLQKLRPVAANLSDPRTGLDRFFRSIARFSSEIAPVASEQGRLFVGLDTTFTALSGVKAAPAALLGGTAAAVRGGHRAVPGGPALPSERRGPLARTSTGRRRAHRRCARTSPPPPPRGCKSLPGVPAFNEDLEDLLVSVQDFAEDPVVTRAASASARHGEHPARPARLPRAAADQAATTSRCSSATSRACCPRATRTARGAEPLRWSLHRTEQRGQPLAGAGRRPGDREPPPLTTATRTPPRRASPRNARRGNADYIVGKTMIGNLPGNQGIVVDKNTAQARPVLRRRLRARADDASVYLGPTLSAGPERR